MDRAQLVAAMQVTAAEKPRPIDVKGWGTLYVRSPTVAEIDEQLAISAEIEETTGQKDKHALARGACRLICDESGKRIFDPANAEDVALLAAQPWHMLRSVTRAVEDDEGNSTSASS